MLRFNMPALRVSLITVSLIDLFCFLLLQFSASYVIQAVAAEIEARYQAEAKATAEAQAQRVHEREVASAAAAALDQEAQVLKREAETSVAAWQRKKDSSSAARRLTGVLMRISILL